MLLESILLKFILNISIRFGIHRDMRRPKWNGSGRTLRLRTLGLASDLFLPSQLSCDLADVSRDAFSVHERSGTLPDEKVTGGKKRTRGVKEDRRFLWLGVRVIFAGRGPSSISRVTRSSPSNIMGHFWPIYNGIIVIARDFTLRREWETRNSRANLPRPRPRF